MGGDSPLAHDEKRTLRELETLLRAHGSLAYGQAMPTFHDISGLDKVNIGACVEHDTVSALALRFCELDALPTSINQLPNLEYLDLAGNHYNALPDTIGNLPRLKYLYFDKNRLARLPETIGEWAALEELYLDQNQLRELPASIGQLDRLRKLYAYNNKLV